MSQITYRPNPFSLVIEAVGTEGNIKLTHDFTAPENTYRTVTLCKDKKVTKNVIQELLFMGFTPVNLVNIVDVYTYVLLDAKVAIHIPKDPDSGVCCFFAANSVEELMAKCVDVDTDGNVTYVPSTIYIGSSLGEKINSSGSELNSLQKPSLKNITQYMRTRHFKQLSLDAARKGNMEKYDSIDNRIEGNVAIHPLTGKPANIKIHNQSTLVGSADFQPKVSRVKVSGKHKVEETKKYILEENAPGQFGVLIVGGISLYLRELSIIGPFKDKKPITISLDERYDLTEEVIVSFVIKQGNDEYTGSVSLIYSPEKQCVIITDHQLVSTRNNVHLPLLINTLTVSN